MKKQIVISCLVYILIRSSALFAQDWGIERQYWSTGTAYLLPAKRGEIGIFQPLRYGLSEKVEVSTHPILFMVMPNFSVKWATVRTESFALALRHGLSHPSPLMRILGRPGIGGMISPEFHIPFILSFQNELLVTLPLYRNHLLTGKLAFNFAYKSGPLDPRTTIDLPIVYIRSGVYYHDYGFKLGGDLKGKLVGQWMYLIDGDLFYYPKAAGKINIAFEHKGMLFWNKSAGFQFCFGYLLSYGEYPFDTQRHLLPLLDLQWGLMKKVKGSK